jgi:hypothetical protein
MFGNDRRWPAAALAGGLALAAWVGCGGEPSVASRSAAAFLEAQKKGETFEGSGHSHGHGAVTPGGAGPEETAPDHSAMDHSAMDHSGEAHGAGHAGQSAHSGHAAQSEQTGHSGHEGHAAPAAPDAPAGHDEHAGHDMSPQTSLAAAPAAVPPGQPAKTLSPDPLDAPAATSVEDAQRSAAMAEEMSGGGGHGGHGGHGASTYRQVDAGRGPEAHEGSEPQTPGHDSHQHGEEGGQDAAAAYVCPMHPEVTSATPGKCSKCGMDLVQRRKG